MAINFTAADRVGSIGGYIGGAAALLGGNALNGLFGGRAATDSDGDHLVSRYEAEKDAKIAKLETDIKLRDANTYTDGKMLDLYQYVDSRLRGVEAQISQQAVVNAQVTANLSCLQTQVATLAGMTKTVIPITNVCPEPMPLKNSWTAPSSTATT